MPRQLPWLNKGGGSRTQVKPPRKAPPKSRIQSDIDDDFFAGTALESSGKRKQRADSQVSDDDLPELPTSYAQTSRKGKEPVRRSRLPSSSPPPVSATLPPPPVEYMQKSVDKFDLRDDEWMMVEDEFLQTAKLFTRHLHLAEYERLKKSIEEKKKEEAAAATPRPVVPNAKPSFERQLKARAKEQAKAQKKAIRDVFRSTSDDDEEQPKRASIGKTASTTTTSRPSKAPHLSPGKPNASGTDSDDLDAPRQPTKAPSNTSNSIPTSFVKPALPTKSRPAASRSSRATPFDLWDDYTPPQRCTSPRKATPTNTSLPMPSPAKPFKPPATSYSSSSSPPKSLQTSTSRPSQPSQVSTTRLSQSIRRPGRSLDLFDDLDFPKRDPLPKEHSERLAKRKAEREKAEQKEKRKSVKLDDIPTFLF
ncbi:hypothetical protein BU26DRAFT_9612 [Trematosphaeria pertusa]|uniref:Uncharacterized protein n=1 Tax=Trematosphaeria pertusa TaxID=390896 RepID=A0A6A6IZQ5_9PLEO|nr:uncharacterized protein BU26DRAFT_9612 [Trematosphaeria pertusa]KAF2255846.1 hypothetical protein BU26DRAFT_9612 [Trematosphaeria pertusa]